MGAGEKMGGGLIYGGKLYMHCIGENATRGGEESHFFHCAEESARFNLGVFHRVGRMTTEKGIGIGSCSQ